MPNDDEIDICFDDDVTSKPLADLPSGIWDDGSAMISATALHEAGHVIALHHHGVPIIKVAVRAHISNDEKDTVPGKTEVENGALEQLSPEQRATCYLAGLYVEYCNVDSTTRPLWIDWVSKREPGCGDDDEKQVRKLATDIGTDYKCLSMAAFSILKRLKPPLLNVAQELAKYVLLQNVEQSSAAYVLYSKDIKEWFDCRSQIDSKAI
jgi:hypothetical protein